MDEGLVVSDLHLFSRRSEAEQLAAGLFEDVEILVLNGDTFDFRWSELPNEEATIDSAIAWLQQLLDQFQGASIHYILGNHDCLTGFRERLEKLAKHEPALSVHEFQLRLGRNLFLHGDSANWRMDERALRRFRDAWSRDTPRGRVAKALYGAVDAAGFSRGFHHLYFPPSRSARRVAIHLGDVLPTWRDEFDHCFFGHTHLPFTKLDLDGVQFHNTGSAIRKMGFLPLRFQP